MEYENIGKLLAAIEAGGDKTPSKETIESEMKRLGFHAIFKVPQSFKIAHPDDGCRNARGEHWVLLDEGNVYTVEAGVYALKMGIHEDIQVFDSSGEPDEDSALNFQDEVVFKLNDTGYVWVLAGSVDEEDLE